MARNAGNDDRVSSPELMISRSEATASGLKRHDESSDQTHRMSVHATDQEEELQRPVHLAAP